MGGPWRHWWTMPVLLFAGIAGAGGYPVLSVFLDPAVAGFLPPVVLYGSGVVVLLALGVLVGFLAVAVLKVVDVVWDWIESAVSPAHASDEPATWR